MLFLGHFGAYTERFGIGPLVCVLGRVYLLGGENPLQARQWELLMIATIVVLQYLTPDIAKKTGPTRKARVTVSHQPAFGLPHAAKQDQPLYTPYLSDLVKNVPAASA